MNSNTAFSEAHKEAVENGVTMEENLSFLDAKETTILRNNRWGGAGEKNRSIALFIGGSNYDIYNNVMMSGGLRMSSGYRRHVWNNIALDQKAILFSSYSFKENQDSILGNIFVLPKGRFYEERRIQLAPSRMFETKMDKNFYEADQVSVRVLHTQYDWDQNSLFGDPQFIDPASGNFQVREGSPALGLGFQNFPMDQFGVKKPSLKAVARAPKIPASD